MWLHLLLFTFGSLLIVSSQSTSHERKYDVRKSLHNQLFGEYNKYIEPLDANLHFNIIMMCAHSKGLPEHPLIASVVEKYSWVDDRLSWTPRNYNNVNKLSLPDHLVWKPDMKLYNYIDYPEHRDPVNVDIFSNGTVIWFPRTVYKTFCSSEFCQYGIGLWTHDNVVMPTTLWEYEPIGQNYDNRNCPLKMKTASSSLNTMYYEALNASYSYVQYNITFEP